MRDFRYGLVLACVLGWVLTVAAGCGGDDDDSSDADDDAGVNDDDADDDADDDSGSDVVPTTLDVTLAPVQDDGDWKLGEGPGEPHRLRNDLGIAPAREPDGDRLSMLYFMTMTDLHQTDEESPTRLTFFDSGEILGGAFGSAFRPQEDLSAHQLNAVVRTANRIQEDYDRSFDVAFSLGDNTDNAQVNEMLQMIDVLDGNGFLSGLPGYARVDSGDLDIDPDTDLNAGERDFGAQETDGEGRNINAFRRPGFPNSNADIPVEGLLRPDGTPVPWFTAIGNHDVQNTGNFNPDSGLTFFSREDYVGEVAHFGLIPGLANSIQYWRANPGVDIFLNGGVFGLDVNWSTLFAALDAVGLVPDDVSADLDGRFDLLTLQNGTTGRDETGDDGVVVAPDLDREFMDHDRLIRLVSEAGHGFADNNTDDTVDGDDGGWYRVDMADVGGDPEMPLRYLVLDTTDVPTLSEGGVSEAQLAWLQSELDRAVDDAVLVILLSHHPRESLFAGAETFRSIVLSCPNVVLHLVGHGHRNSITAFRDGDNVGGYWEVETPSTIEFPEQARIVELVDNRDGTGSAYVTLFDHYVLEGDDADILAREGRRLAFEDALRGGMGPNFSLGGMGTALDRNGELLFEIPEDVDARLAGLSSDQPVTSAEVLGTRYGL